MIGRVKEAAMRGGDKRLAMERAGDGKSVKEEVDRMNVDDIGIAEMIDKLRSSGIAAGSKVPDAPNRQAVDFGGVRQYLIWTRENSVAGEYADIVTVTQLFTGEISHEVLKASATRVKLPNDMKDLQRLRRWCDRGHSQLETYRFDRLQAFVLALSAKSSSTGGAGDAGWRLNG